MNELSLIALFLKLKDNILNYTVIRNSYLDISVRQENTKILLSFLINEQYLKDSNNDEVVLEINLYRNSVFAKVDISDSYGTFFFKRLWI